MFTNSENNKKKSNKVISERSESKKVKKGSKQNKKSRASYGVTMMSLVITIIVMLILAGVTITLSVGENGVLKKTKKNIGVYENSANVDDNNIEEYSEYVRSLVNVPSAKLITLTAAPSQDYWTRGDVTVTASYDTKNISSTTRVQMKMGDGDEWNEQTSITVPHGSDTESHITLHTTVYARFINKIDNTSSDYVSLDVANIDTDNPSADAPTITATTSTITVTCNQKDATSGIQMYEYSIDGGTTWVNDGVIKGSGSSDSEAGSNGSSSTTTQNDKATSAKTTAVIGGTQHTFTGLDQNKTYSIATRVTDFVGHQIATKAIDKKTSEVPTLVVADKDIVFTADPDQEKDVWSNTTVKVSAELAEKYSKDYVLQLCDVTGKTEEQIKATLADNSQWKDNTSEITVEHNGNIYARLRDKRTNATGSEAWQYSAQNTPFSIKHIDKTKPSQDAPEIAEVTTCNVKVTLRQYDIGDSGSNDSTLCAGLDTSKTQYRLLRDKADGEDTSKLTIDETTGKVVVRAWQSTGEFTGLDQGIKYYAQTKATDRSGSGNTIESELKEVTTGKVTDLTESNVTFEESPSLDTWTNGNVAVKVTTTDTDFTLQVRIEKDEWANAKTSSDGKSQTITVSVPSSYLHVFARLTDGTNVGGSQSVYVDHIDKEKPDQTAPTLAKVNPTSSKITATFNQQDSAKTSTSAQSGLNEGTIQYAIKKTSDSSWGAWVTDAATHTFSNLAANTEYQVKTQVTDNAGNTQESAISKITTDKVPSVDTNTQGGSAVLSLTPDTTDWTNDKVKVTVATNTKGYTIETSTDNQNWTETNPLIFTANGTAYARLWDGAQTTGVATLNITNVDKVKPTTSAPTLEKLAPTSSVIKATITQDDGAATTTAPMYGKSGVKTREYAIKKTSDTKWGDWVTDTDKTETTHTFTNLAADTEYQVKTRVVDNAGNSQESETAKISTDKVPEVDSSTQGGSPTLKLTADNSEWTNGNVKVTATTNTKGYTIQMSTTSPTSGYEDVSEVTFTANGIAYARLWDGAQTSAVALLNITNIDKIVPTTSAPTAKVVAPASSKVEVTLNQDDGEATIIAPAYGKSGIKTIQYAIKEAKASDWGEWVTDTEKTHIFSNLKAGTEYQVKTKVTDKAGNHSETSAVSVTTSYVPSVVTDGSTDALKLTATPTTDTWTKGNVVVTAETNAGEGYTIQMSTDNTTFDKTSPLTFEGKGTAYARLYDGANHSEVAHITISRIDKLAPTKDAPTYTLGVPASTTVKITFNQTDPAATDVNAQSGLNASTKKYAIKKKSDTDWQWTTDAADTHTYTGLTANTEYQVKTIVKDIAGNETESSVATFKTSVVPTIDTNGKTSALKLTPSTTDWTNQDVKVTATTDQSGYKIQTCQDGNTWKDVSEQTFTANGTMYAHLTDGTNVTGTATLAITNIDKTKPSTPAITAKITDANGANYTSGAWTNNSVYVKLTSTDDASGVVKYEFAGSNNNWSEGSFAFDTTSKTSTATFTAERNETVKFRATDEAGNISEESNIVIRIDKTKPTDTVPTATATTRKITLTLKQADQGTVQSGIDASKTLYRLLADANGNTVVKDWQTSSEFDGLTQDKTYYFQSQVTDNAGNNQLSTIGNAKTGAVTQSQGNITFTLEPNSWTNGNVKVTATTSITSASGSTLTLQTKLGKDGKWQNGTTASGKQTGTQTATAQNQVVYARLWDGLNDGGTASTTILNIDTIAPSTTTPTVALAAPTASKITVTFNQEDATATPTSGKSGIKTRQYAYKKTNDSDIESNWKWVTDNATTHSFTGLSPATKYDFKTRATDNANNSAESSPVSVTTASMPTVSITLSTENWTKNNVTATASSTDTSGYTIQMSKDNSNWSNASTLTFSTNGTAYARITDGTNTTSVVSKAITKIDKLNPLATAPTAAPAAPTASKITVTFKQDDAAEANGSGKSGIKTKEYAIKKNADSNWGSWVADTNSTHSFTGLITGTKYDVKTRATDNAGNSAESSVTSVTTSAMPDASTAITLTANPSTWTNGNVTVSATTTAGTGYTIQMSTSSSSGFASKTSLTFSANGTAYAKLTDGTNTTTGVASLAVTKIDKLKPNTTAPTAAPAAPTASKITVTFKQDDAAEANGSAKSGIKTRQYAYKKSADTTWSSWVTDNNTTHSFTGLSPATKYDFKTRATDNANNSAESSPVSVTTDAMPTPTINLSTTAWTNGTVTATASSATGYTTQTSTNNSTWGTTNPLSYTANGTAYARYYDGKNYSSVVSKPITNIDTTKPTNTAPTTTTTTSTITATLKQTDANSGINTSKTKYRLVSDTNATSEVKTWQTSNVFSGLTQNKTYYVQSQVTDNAGNTQNSAVATAKTGTIPSPNITWTLTPSTATNGTVSVKAATSVSGYTLQTSTNNSSWGTTNPLTYSVNGTAYARLWDGTNASSVATKTIDIIDKLAPTVGTPTATLSDAANKKVTVTANSVVDPAKTSQYSQSGIKTIQYQYSTSSTFASGNSDWVGSDASTTHTFTLSTGTYYFRVKATDKAGNVSSISAISAATKVVATAKLTKSDGTTVTITQNTDPKTIYGTAIKYGSDSSITWRAFYIDFNMSNKYKDGAGSIYLKADPIALGHNVLDYEESSVGSGNKIWQMNPQYASKVSSTLNGNENAKGSLYLNDPSKWTTYKTTDASYAIGAPSIEMFCDSYSVFDSTFATRSKGWSAVSSVGYTSATNLGDVSESYANKMYTDSSTWYWLSSPGSSATNAMQSVRGRNGYLNYNYASDKNWSFCPVVCLTVKLS